jgi:hypothetical protein
MIMVNRDHDCDHKHGHNGDRDSGGGDCDNTDATMMGNSDVMAVTTTTGAGVVHTVSVEQ